MFRSHVERRSHKLLFVIDRGCSSVDGNTEVAYLDVEIGCDEDIQRLNVSMMDAYIVKGGERAPERLSYPHSNVHGHRGISEANLC